MIQKWRWYRKLCYFFKLLKGQSPDYLSKILPSIRRAYNTRNSDYIPCFNTKHNFSRNSFCPWTLIEWNNLDINIRNSESYTTFKKSILRFIRPSENPIFNCHNPSRIKLITRLRLGLSHLREHKFRHNFQDKLNSICSCGESIEIWPSWPNFKMLKKIFLMEIIPDFQRYSFSVILHVTMQKTQVF